jgi:hypothetical protein
MPDPVPGILIHHLATAQGLRTMRISRIPPLLRHLCALVLLLLGLDLAAPLACASGAPMADTVGFTSRAAVFFTGLLTEVIYDRARLIQVSVLIVALGIALLYWRK